ncbi:GNAT family N-acetyltransferase [Halobacillus sp. K22]|uniref:GNAT family N-acetyltransferase n=1 Tax=Halobacillus sp. K22 TaxID=3457431 RepID=UPI003FCC8F43
MNFREIDIEKDKEIVMQFRNDIHLIEGNKEGFDKEAYLNRLEKRINEMSSGQFIIEDDHHQPIGQIGLKTEVFNGETAGYVNLYYLIDEYRNKGLGKQLVQFTEEFFRDQGICEYYLSVAPGNQKAIEFYSKVGLVEVSRNEKNSDELLMKKSIQF